MHLVEVSVMEQRYQAVMAVVQDGWKVTDVADRLGVSRQAVHKWIARYDLCPTLAPAPVSHSAPRLRLLGDTGSGTCVPPVPRP